MATVQLSTQYAHLSIETHGAHVVSWTMLDSKKLKHSLLYQGTELKRTGIPILFPNFGKSNMLPQHGFGRNSEWRIREQSENRIVLILTDTDITEEMRQMYPFPFATEVKLALKDSSFTYELIVQNTSGKPMPISPGLHPYWAVENSLKQQVTTQGINGFDAEKIDWSHQPPDNVYDYNGNATIQFPDKTLTIEDVTEPAPVCEHLVVWSQPIDKPDYNFICFEPITRGNYALDNHPILVAPGKEWGMKLRFGVTAL